MEAAHDPLLATALVIESGGVRLALVGVDHLGYDYAMVQAVAAGVEERTGDATLEIFLGSSHTHAGGGAYLDIPGLGEVLAGKFDPAAVQVYIDGAVDAVVAAVESLQPARVGIGYGRAEGLNRYRGDWPPNVDTIDDVAVLKVTTAAGEPLGVWFNFAAHATVLPGAGNMSFSADFVGYARAALQEHLGDAVVPIFFNGAQGDVSPAPPRGDDMWERCESMGRTLAASVLEVWHRTETNELLQIEVARRPYDLKVEPTSAGTKLPYETRPSELGLIVLNDVHAFVAVPGELSCIYDADIRRFGGWLGYEHNIVLGLTNDAHGYIITPEAWRHRIYESTVSFGGETYGEWVKSTVYALLHALEPEGSYQEDRVLPSSLLISP